MLLGLDDRFEIENTHAELRDLKLSRSLDQIWVGEILPHRTKDIDTSTVCIQEVHSHGGQPGSVGLDLPARGIEVVRLQLSEGLSQAIIVLLRGKIDDIHVFGGEGRTLRIAATPPTTMNWTPL